MRYIQASYTVEAAAVMGFVLGAVFLMLMLGVDVYRITVDDINHYEVVQRNPSDVFRSYALGKEILEEVID